MDENFLIGYAVWVLLIFGLTFTENCNHPGVVEAWAKMKREKQRR